MVMVRAAKSISTATIMGNRPKIAVTVVRNTGRSRCAPERITASMGFMPESSDPAPRLFLGLALAYLGRGADGVRAGEQGLASIPPSRDVIVSAYFQHQLARIYVLAGEQDKAIALVKTLLTEPYHLSPGWLSIDPNFDPLRGNPRFQELLRR